MGEAYNERGELMGTAFGKSKQDVLNKLMDKFAGAKEVRIKKLQESPKEEKMLDEDASFPVGANCCGRQTAVGVLDNLISRYERKIENLRRLKATVASAVTVNLEADASLWELFIELR